MDKRAFLAAHLRLMLHVSYTWNGKSVRTHDKKEEREFEYKAAQCSIDVVKAYLYSSFHCHSTCSTIYKIKNVSQPRDIATNTFVTITNTHICIYIHRKKIQNPPSLKNKEQIHVYILYSWVKNPIKQHPAALFWFAVFFSLKYRCPQCLNGNTRRHLKVFSHL